MNEMDQKEWDRWDKIRSKGKAKYLVRWVLYWILFMSFVQATIMLTRSTTMEIIDFIALAFVSVVVGASIALMRWNVFERRYHSKSLTSL